MRRMLAFSLVATVLLASCEKEIVSSEDVKIPGTETSVLRIGIPDTKTSLGELDGSKRKVYWSDGDKVSVNGIESEALSGIAEKSTEAEFALTAPASAPYSIVYPSDIWVANGLVNLPATQTYVAGNVADGAVPMAGYSASGLSATLGYLCAVVKVSIAKDDGAYPDTDDISTVAFAGNADEQLSGHFVVDYENGTLSEISSVASGSVETKAVTMVELQIGKTVTVSPASPIPAESSLDVYLVVPARTYESGFSVTITDVEGHSMVKSTPSSATLQAGHIYNLTPVKFKPTGSASVINIGSAEELVTFASTYNTGELSDRELTVNLTDDISFSSTTSAAFSATGGIGVRGEDNYYFHGTFNGNNKTISGYSGGAPIFAYIDGTGVVKDLKIDSSCSFVFTHGNTAEADFGALAGYHKGTIDNVTVNADVSLAAVEDVANLTALGGIVGRCTVGSISNSTFGGAITVPDGFTTTKKLLVGGILGYSSNNTGSVSSCVLDGTIGVGAKVTSTDKDNPYLIVGGIVGYNKAAVSNCVTNDHPTVTTLHSGATSVGTIVVKTIKAYYTAVGGFIGENAEGEISDCTNGASIFNTIFKDGGAGGAGDASARYMRSGGIVGKNNSGGIVSSCINNAKVQHRSNPRIQSLAGIVGHNAGTVKNCTNNADVNHMTTGISGATKKGGRIVDIAGIIGDNIEGAEVTNVHNTANIQISAMEDNYDTDNNKPVCEVRMGGVIAYNKADIGEGSTKITNSGQVYFNNNMTYQFIGYELGGIVGYSVASVQNAKNTGYVVVNWASNEKVASKFYLGGIVGVMAGDGTIAGCVNEGGESNAGEVYLNVKKGAAKHTDNYIGGVLGYSKQSVSISNCSNSGYVHGGNATKQNGTSCYAGGIAAYLNGASSITDCENSGIINNEHFSNSTGTGNTSYNGGIAGWVSGSSETPVSISGCTQKTSDLGPFRGYSGGVVGYANYASLQDCNVIGINFTDQAYFIGGVAGWAVNSTISNCSVTGTSIVSSQTQSAGGIVAKLGAATTLDGCSSAIATITGPEVAAEGITYKYGAIAGESVEGSTIKNCHYPASGTITGGGSSHPWQICSDTNFTDGGGNTTL